MNRNLCVGCPRYDPQHLEWCEKYDLPVEEARESCEGNPARESLKEALKPFGLNEGQVEAIFGIAEGRIPIVQCQHIDWSYGEPRCKVDSLAFCGSRDCFWMWPEEGDKLRIVVPPKPLIEEMELD